MGGRLKTTEGINGFDTYAVNVLVPPNTESDESDLNNITKKRQDKNKFSPCNALSDTLLNQILDIIVETDAPIPGNLDDRMWIRCEPPNHSGSCRRHWNHILIGIDCIVRLS